MDEMVKNSIEARKQALYNAYNIEGSSVEKQINDLFIEIEKFGSKYNDIMDFENAFQASDLNNKYINLFTEVSTKCSPKVTDTSTNKTEETTYRERSDAEYFADELSRPIRRQARQKVDDTLRSTPIIGDAMNIKQHIDLFNKFRGNKKDQD